MTIYSVVRVKITAAKSLVLSRLSELRMEIIKCNSTCYKNSLTSTNIWVSTTCSLCHATLHLWVPSYSYPEWSSQVLVEWLAYLHIWNFFPRSNQQEFSNITLRFLNSAMCKNFFSLLSFTLLFFMHFTAVMILLSLTHI